MLASDLRLSVYRSSSRTGGRLHLLDGQATPTRTSFPMGNYVIRAGNYVSTSRSTMGNYVSADTSC
jgi:hypothetical protein